MAKFDRYFLSQLLMLFGFFSLVLVLVYWVNRAVALFDTLIANGESAVVFLEFSALTLPNVIRVVLPVAAFVATVYVTNRLSNESELVIVQSTGFSPYRLARPVLGFGLIVAVLMSLLTHYLVPTSSERLAARTAEIAENVASSLLVEGTFMHPADGITFYMRDISTNGELSDMFLSDARDDALRVTYTAKLALLVREDSGPKLLMFDGMVQSLRYEDQTLSTTKFEDLVFDLGGLVSLSGQKARRISHLPTADLFAPSDALLEEVDRPAGQLRLEGHERITQALICVVAIMAGFSCLMIGPYSRFGIWKQVVGAVILLVVIETLDNTMADVASENTDLWPLMYVASIVGLLVSLLLLWLSTKPALFARRRRYV